MTTSTGESAADLRDQPGRGAIPADTFAARLRLVRMHAGDLTILEAAERTGLNYGSWSNWERGMMPRDLRDVVLAITGALGIDRDWLMYGGQLAPEPRRRGRGGSLAERRRGLTFRDDSRDGDVTARSVPRGRTISEGRPPRRAPDNRPAGRPDASTRPVRLSRPII